MSELETAQASAILARPANDWTKEDNRFIYALIKRGLRDELKALRNQVLLND